MSTMSRNVLRCSNGNNSYKRYYPQATSASQSCATCCWRLPGQSKPALGPCAATGHRCHSQRTWRSNGLLGSGCAALRPEQRATGAQGEGMAQLMSDPGTVGEPPWRGAPRGCRLAGPVPDAPSTHHGESHKELTRPLIADPLTARCVLLMTSSNSSR